MLQCPDCASAAAFDQRYCLECGARIAPRFPRVVAAAQPAVVIAAPAPRPWPQNLPSGPVAATLVLGVLSFGVIAGGAANPLASAAGRQPPIQLALTLPPAAATPEPVEAASDRPSSSEPVADAAPVSAPVASSGVAETPEPTATPTPEPTATPEPTPTDPEQPPVKHVFVVWLSGDAETDPFGEDSTATYLNETLVPQGTLLARYGGTGESVLSNGLALAAGLEETDEPDAPFEDGTPSLADKLAEIGLTARAYQQDPCDAPIARNPFSWFSAECAPLDRLEADAAADDAPALSFIAPAPCDAGEPGTCPPEEPDGLARSDAFLSTVVPLIRDSPAYADDGMLVVVFDRGAGALVVSPYSGSGTTSRKRYDHYALSRTLARIFGVDPLGQAAGEDVRPFGPDVWPPAR